MPTTYFSFATNERTDTTRHGRAQFLLITRALFSPSSRIHSDPVIDSFSTRKFLSFVHVLLSAIKYVLFFSIREVQFLFPFFLWQKSQTHFYLGSNVMGVKLEREENIKGYKRER